MSFSETIFLFVLALIIFGPKKLPEIARQAGKLLAELRRASNEFKSQIETEISHLEVQKNKELQSKAVVPSAPQGTVASLSVNPAVGETIPHHAETAATLVAPNVEPAAAASSAVPAPSDSTPAEAVTDHNLPASQEFHA
ncbi:MAG: twin-arginine translocase TatA/TatE family subunit [Candidatus Sulfotelmatobacter sp.]